MLTSTTAIGRLTENPKVISYKNNSGELVRFTLAVKRSKKDETDFYECIAFDKVAENIKKFLGNGKGRLIHVNGRFENNNSERKTKGGEAYTNYGMTLVVNDFDFLDSPPQDAGHGQQQQQQAPRGNYQPQQAPQQQPQQPAYQAAGAYQPAPQGNYAPQGGYAPQGNYAPQGGYPAPPQQPSQQNPYAVDPFANAGGFNGFPAGDLTDDDLPF